MKSKTIKVDYLARVEGEGALYVKYRGDQVLDVQLKIFEPPRFFEAFLRGRSAMEAPDITARICGICPVAYMMSAVHAVEDALGMTVDEPLRTLRRLIYCGEWMESHTLHIYLLHAPDFFGLPDAIHLAQKDRAAVERGLQLKKAGNEIISLLGGREVHPINVRVGGFYRTPTKADLGPLAERLKWARDAALETVRWTARFDFPNVSHDYEFVSLRHPHEYPFNEGRLVSNKELDIAAREFDDHFQEEHVRHSNALHCRLKARGNYFVGPLARYNLNFDRLTPLVQEAAREAGLGPTCTNPFQSIVVRSLEVLYACDEALRIINGYEPPPQPFVPASFREGTGYACTEAPRGTLYHRYRLAADGTIQDAKIVPPTSQNQMTIEEDLRRFVPGWIDLPSDQLTWKCEQAVRNYDPCISCSAHFLKLHMETA